MDTGCSLRTKRHWQCLRPAWYSLLHRFFLRSEQAVERIFPSRKRALQFVLIEALEHVAANGQPGAVRIIEVHHLAPDSDGQPESRLLIPGNGRHLKRPFSAYVENR